MKRIFIVIAAALAISSSAASADRLLDEIAATPGKAGGVYYAYPTESSQNTPAPKGYRPFYISHYGTHYIMRLEMDEKPWENEDNSDFFDGYDTTVGQALFADMAEEKISEVVLNEEVLGEYTMADSAINYRF